MKLIFKAAANKPGIYKITNTHTRRIYIGQAARFEQRWYDHQRNLKSNRHQNRFLLNDFNKCFEELGHDNFIEFEVIEIMEGSTKEERNKREEEIIAEHWDKQEFCYNFKQKTEVKERSCYSNTPEKTSNLISNNSKKHWKKNRNRLLEIFRDPAFKQKQSEKRKLVASNPEQDPSRLGTINAWKDPKKRERRIEKLRKASLEQFGNKDYGWIINTITGERIKLDNIKLFACKYNENVASVYTAIRNNKTYFKHWKFERPGLIQKTQEEIKEETRQKLVEIKSNPEYRQKMSNKTKELWANEEYHKNQSEKRIGHSPSKEARQKMSEAQKKIGNNPPSPCGRECSVATREKLSKANKGHVPWSKGKKLTKEHKKKIKEAHLRRQQKQ